MNANSIINNEMSLDEKLAAIDAALAMTSASNNNSSVDVPIDPSEALMCQGCQ